MDRGSAVGGGIERLVRTDLILGYHLGVEVECRIAEAINLDGDQPAALPGRVPFDGHGAYAPTLARAIGIAGKQNGRAAGEFRHDGEAVPSGAGAGVGHIAADLAALGWTAGSQIPEARNGFFHAAGGLYDARALTFGEPWTFPTPGFD
jgi:hypothetical protein